MHHFVALLHYFGICCLPQKEDYWDTEHYMPTHSIVHELGMSMKCFQFMWRHFHVYLPDDYYADDDVQCADDVDNSELVDQTLEQIQRVQVWEEREDENENEDSESEDNANTNQNVWFTKLKPLIDHVHEVSSSLIYVLGIFLSLDEMMIHFMGMLLEIHRIKSKPIKEGYKIFVLSTSKGFVVNVTPDGQRASKTKQQEYNTTSIAKIESMILYVLGIIEELKQKQKQKQRLRRYEKASRSENQEACHKPIMKDFCLVMEKYFTLPKIIKKLRELGIGVVGTARF